MPTDLLLTTAREALYLALAVCAPVVLAALIAGLLTGVLQAATQIQDATLGFVPKVAAVVLALSITGPFVYEHLLGFTHAILDHLAQVS